MAERAARADHASTRPATTPTARRTTSRGCRTRRRPSTRSTASSRSISTRAASRARGRRWSSTSTARRPPQIRTHRRARAVVRGSHAVGSEVPQGRRARRHRQRHRRRRSKPATPGRSRRSASTCRTIRRSASATAASRCRCRTSTRRTTSRRCRNSAASSRGRRRKPSARTTWSAFAGELTTNMHEVIGHGSGKVDERLNGNPQAALKEQFSAIEESRADLVALYFLPDPKLVELGLVAGGRSRRHRARRVRGLRAQRARAAAPRPRGHARSKKTTCATAR